MPKPKRRPSPNNRLVAAVAYDPLCTFEFGIVADVFGLDRPEMGPDWYSFAVASADEGPLRATGGLRVEVDGGLDVLREAGTIFLPGWKGLTTPVPDRLKDELLRAHRRGARILTICSGAFALAETGLLDGLKATTHWRYVDQFAERYPRVKVERDVLYVDEGDILTSAGSAAGIDLCLHLIRRDHGVKAANAIARRLVVPPHRDGGQAQYVEQPVPRAHEGARLSPLIESLANRLSEQISVGGMAEEVGMSERTFIRRFEAATGMPPARWLARQRMRRACDLLELSRASTEEIAALCGYQSASTLRRHFRRQMGASPAAWRARFGGDRIAS
jgi:AraC family transcriptional activator FtrA